jgi:8-amino-7-oxononanoate synthase
MRVRFESFLGEALAKSEAAGLLREPDDGAVAAQVAVNAAKLGLPFLDAASNDYLGLGRRSVSRETPCKAGAGASRLVYGTTSEHLKLEAALAEWVGTESALLFSSTYSANLGLVSALGVEGSLIISDAANHASLIDGARLARSTVVVIPHLDIAAVEPILRAQRAAVACWVLTESYFSMDGDGPDLRGLRALCNDYDACLVVDEAHALGVFGPQGAGRCAELGVRADVVVGALGKAVGTHGGFVAGSALLRRYLWNRARSFVFSTAPSPEHSELTHLQVASARGADSLRAQLAANAARLRDGLAAANLPLVPDSFGPIVSVVVGSNARASQAAARLRERGILAQAIRPPTVPVGSARLRLTVKATFTAEDIARLTAAVEEACRA